MESARLAVITDLHHGLAPDALSRFRAFTAEVSRRRNLHAVLQLGDFCYSDVGSAECLAEWNAVAGARLSVLGNHDMDKCDKDTAMRAAGMASRYWSRVVGGYRFVALDLNHFKKGGVLVPYATGNYFTDGATYNWADADQLAWLQREIENSAEPVVVLSHQPLGMPEPDKSLPPEQREVFDVMARATSVSGKGRVVACISGHLHVDRLEHVDGIACLSLNSASYFWYEGMHAYTKPLFAFMEFTTAGELIVEGRAGAFVESPPSASDVVAGRSGAILDRRVPFKS
ncbi:MAG TPA: metallophosphoesterase [Gemmatimonadaceae bacterium]|nr:metallophosphoesterase [Gemmatimonadaceae bacterium]